MGWNTLIKEGVEEERNTINDAGEDYERPTIKSYGVKLAKADVNYTAAGPEAELCIDCRFWNKNYYYGTDPSVSAGYCNLVEGSIDPNGSCDEYASPLGPFN